jgi:formylglycine-generating enzyme
MRTILLLPALLCFQFHTSLAQDKIPTIFQKAEAANPANPNYRFLWRTDPGVRYHLQTSENLSTWTDVPGYPKRAEGPVEFHDLAPVPGGKQFVKATLIDEQPPVIVRSNPADGAFAVPRFSDLTFVLEDYTGINPASIQLSIAGGSPITLANSPNLTFVGNVLTYDVVDTAIGTFGQQIPIYLTMADTLGNATTHTVICEVESQAQLAVEPANVFVFGSAAAQRSGQRLSARHTLVTRAIYGSVRLPANGGNTYELTQILPDRLVISFTGTPPTFLVNQIVTNTAAASPDEVFYRRITSLSTSGNVLTLMTQTLDLRAIIQNGTVTLGDQSVILPSGSAPARRVARSFDGRYNFEPVSITPTGWEAGIDFKTPEGLGVGVKLIPDDVSFALAPYVGCSAEIKSGQLQRIRGYVGGDFAINTVCDLEISSGVSLVDKSFRLSKYANTTLLFTYLGNVGLIPVFAALSFDVEFEFTVDSQLATTRKIGSRRSFKAEVGIGWPGDEPILAFNESKPQTLAPFTPPNGTTNLSAEVNFKLRSDFLLYGLVGFGGGAYPYAKIDIGTVVTPPDIYNKADLTYGWKWFAEVVDPLDLIQAKIGGDIGNPIVKNLLNPDQPSTEPIVTITPAGVNIGMCYMPDQFNPTGPMQSLLWYGGNPIPGTTNLLSLTLPNQNYQFPLKVVGTYQGADGKAVEVASQANPPLTPAPAGFSLIPGGSFTMGRTSGDTDSNAPPVTVYVSAFFMANHETSKILWEEVRAWGMNNGYTDLSGGGSGNANHPSTSINWFDSVKWCNARSQMEGLFPVYLVDGVVFKTGVTVPTMNSSANGYRLPTEAEWEKAARGGVSEKRYSWGKDTISHSQANYYALASSYGNLSGNTGFHPFYNDSSGGIYTAPVDSFAPNGYGLFNMAGNVWEWCWDWYDLSTYTGGVSNPSGAESGSYRIFRGGSWMTHEYDCRSANRGHFPPTYRRQDFGFGEFQKQTQWSERGSMRNF